MHPATQRRTPFLRFLLPAVLLVAACDRGDEELESPELEERAAMAAPGAYEDGSPRGHGHRGKGHKLEKLCEKLACTDDQRARIEGVAARLWAERPEPAGDRAAAKQALARAFGGDAFSAADLQAYHAAVKPDADEMDAALVEAVGELHGILDAQQRAMLADKIEKRGLPFVGGRGGKHHDKGGDDEARGEKRAARLCEKIACVEEQQARIAALVQARPEAGQVPEAERKALAQAFRGESLPDDVVNAYLDAAATVAAADRAARDAQAVQLHGMLTPEQRAMLAERIAERGPKVLGLHGKGHGGKHGKKAGRGGKKGRRGSGPQGEAQQFG